MSTPRDTSIENFTINFSMGFIFTFLIQMTGDEKRTNSGDIILHRSDGYQIFPAAVVVFSGAAIVFVFDQRQVTGVKRGATNADSQVLCTECLDSKKCILCNMKTRVRFAPSPTGKLHVGNVLHVMDVGK